MIRWFWAFIDRPAADFEASAEFWTAVTGTTLSPRRGERAEFATLLPPVGEGDPCVKLQGVLHGGGAHIDMEFDDFDGAVERVVELGGEVVARDDVWAYAKSPSGYGFCVTTWNGGTQPPRGFVGPDGSRSRLDQVCVDVAPSAFDAELAFWSGVSGLEVMPSRRFAEFSWLRPPEGTSVAVLFQRVGEERPTSAHLDVSCSDADATRAWHETLGAEFVAERGTWLVMRDPVGWEYCLIRKDPDEA
ncbi:MAG: VOC family protein [Catenulispora sp.]|nr:VOC family protein [Catenulispora sp.]